MSVRIGSRTLGERSQKQGVIFLWSKACHADKKNIVLSEAFPCPPFLAWSLRPSIAIRWNAVRNDAAPLNSIKVFYAESYFLRDGDRNNSVVEGVMLKPAEPRFNLALGQVVDRMQERNFLAQEQERQCGSKNKQMVMDNVRPAFFENRLQSVEHAGIQSRPLGPDLDSHSG